MRINLKSLSIGVLITSVISAAIPAQTEIVEAQWEVHLIKFQYAGFSSHYTCDGVESTLRRLLKLIGARDDARVETNCHGSNEVKRFHMIKLAFSMPILADKTDLSREIFPAEWQKVRVAGNHSRYLDSGDCELLEHFQRHVMPHLYFRDIKKRVRCIPYRSQFNSLRFDVTALKALEKIDLEPARSKGASELTLPE